MLFHLMFACWGFAAPVLLWQMTRTGAFHPRGAFTVGVVSGMACGAGVAIGLFFQETTANIDSGYSFSSVGQWLSLAATGGAVGLVLGLLLARLARTWRPAVAAFLLFAIVATVGWVVAASRPVIDCDYNETFCAERYG